MAMLIPENDPLGSDLCIDCDGTGKYPSGEKCKSCLGSGRVLKGDGIAATSPDAINALTKAERRVLDVLVREGPLFNGTLGDLTDLVFNSRVFDRLERMGLIEGHPYTITKSGRDIHAALSAFDGGRS